MKVVIETKDGRMEVDTDRVEFFEDCVILHPNLERFEIEDVVEMVS